MDLTTRQQAILAYIVQQYISTATPVGSEAIRQRLPMRTSGATVRHEMVILEELGYLSQPHTSAGRVPTAKGYRYFVERLMEQSDLSGDEKVTIKHQFHQSDLDLEQWMKLAASVLSRSTRMAALITAPKSAQARFKHLELLNINDSLLLLILVMRDGTVKQQMMASPQPAPNGEELSTLATKLNAKLDSMDAKQVSALMTSATGVEAQVLDRVATFMYQLDQAGNFEIHRAGLNWMLQQPEFNSGSRAERLMQVLEVGNALERVFDETMSARGVQIVIGGNDRWEDMQDVSLIISRYGIADEASGVVGVIGPLRMPYGRAISTVRYIASVMDDLIELIYK